MIVPAFARLDAGRLRLAAAGVAVALAAPSLARGAEEKPRLAVLEFSSKLGNREVEPGYFSEVVRGVALDEAPGTRVITRESLLTLLEASGKDAASCEGECEVDTGRRIGADYIVSGELWKIGSTFHLRMKLHDTRTADLLSVADASGKTVDELDASTADAARKLFVPLRSTKPSVRVATAPPQRQPAPSTAPLRAAARAPAGMSGWRRAGFALVGAGVALGAASTVFALLGKAQNDRIKAGGLATSTAISDAASSGQRDNTFSIGLAVAGAAAVAVGVPLILVHGEAAQAAISASPTGVSLAGRF